MRWIRAKFAYRESGPELKRRPKTSAPTLGHRIHKAGRRVTQLGATFVIGPGAQVRYEHVDDHSADHAALEEVLAVLPTPAAD